MTKKYNYINHSYTEAELKGAYRSWKGYEPSTFGHWLGYADYWVFLLEMDGWCAFIDACFPDYFPFSTIQGILQEIVNYVHDRLGANHYNAWAEKGDNLIKRFDDLFGDYERKIKDAEQRLKNMIDKAQEWLADHEKRLKELESELGFPLSLKSFIGKLP